MTSPEPSLPVANRLRQWGGQLVVPLLVIVAAGGFWQYMYGGTDHRDELPPVEQSTTGETPDTVTVTVEPVSFRTVQRSVEAVGTLFGFEDVVISAKVEGRVVRIHHEVADRLKPDELLVEIDPTDYELAVKQADSALHVELAKYGLLAPPDKSFDLEQIPQVVLAQAKLENSARRMERLQVLAAKNAASAEELENVVSEVRMMRADFANQLLQAKSGLAMIRMRESALETAKQQLDDTHLVVPTPTRALPGSEDGVTFVMTKRACAEGTFVRVGGEICRLTIDRVLKLRVLVPERYSSQVKLGQRAQVQTAAYTQPFAGTVTLINPSVDSATRTFEVEIQVANENGALKPGSFAKATIETYRQEDTPTVPLAAVVNFAGVTKVFLVENGQAREVLITPGVQTQEWVEIAQPALPRNAIVVTSGQSHLSADMPVVVRGTEMTQKPGDPLRFTSRPKNDKELPVAQEEQEQAR